MTCRALCLLFCGLLLAACGSLSKPDHVVSSRALTTYTVRSGDTLHAIAWGFGVDYRRLATLNHLSPPYALRVGQPLRLRHVARVVAHKKKKVRHHQHSPVRESVVPHKVIAAGGHWQRPATGQMRRVPHGVNILGRYGAPVRAAASGVVVYSGSGLRGYGRLIILKHAAHYLSAYAYNSQLLVHEGKHVKAGQIIARVGHTDLGRVMLHFELRKNGRPVNAMAYL